MSFWTWVAIAIALISGILFSNSSKRKAERKHIVALTWFIIAVILFFVWWFTR
ncbi:hypothetical protein VKA52_03070 [Halobacillus sp. HZG1]|uniref:hypothetical protein n=1 Tax=Halobacillus sp. HZG1 TaxID=3111769 RepID=UPI002DBD1689|nr:hypothetical protein [Halobacillus sp. HZG1]MEC3882706.1 hypothetical protein [Halobacillus sp. HZG1]